MAWPHLPIQDLQKQLVDIPERVSTTMRPKSVCMALPILLSIKKQFQMPPLRTVGQATLRNAADENTTESPMQPLDTECHFIWVQ